MWFTGFWGVWALQYSLARQGVHHKPVLGWSKYACLPLEMHFRALLKPITLLSMPTFDVAALEEEHQKQDASKKCCIAEYQFRPMWIHTDTSEIHKKTSTGRWREKEHRKGLGILYKEEVYLKHSCIDQYHPFPLDKHECHPGPKPMWQYSEHECVGRIQKICVCV